jgi:uncharacterized protein (UPF0332 family)
MAEEVIGRRYEIELYMSHADKMLQVAEHNLAEGFYSTAVNRAYYGLSRGKHSGVVAAFRQHFVKPGLIEAEFGRMYGQLMDDRRGADYDLETIVEPEQAAADVEHAHRFIARVRQYLQQEGWL